MMDWTRATAWLAPLALCMAATRLSAAPYVFYHDDFESYDIDERPSYVALNQTANVLSVQQDTENWFGLGTDNQFLQARKARQHSILVPTADANTGVVTLSFDFITRNLPADGDIPADTRLVNIQFYAGDPDVVALNNTYRAHITSLRLTNTTVRTAAALGNPSYGDLDELIQFHMGFNNTNESAPYYDPEGNQLGILPAGTAAVWANGELILSDWNQDRAAAAGLGWNIHGIGFVFDSATIASYDLDNLTVTVPEPSSAMLLIGLGAMSLIRRRKAPVAV